MTQSSFQILTKRSDGMALTRGSKMRMHFRQWIKVSGEIPGLVTFISRPDLTKHISFITYRRKVRLYACACRFGGFYKNKFVLMRYYQLLCCQIIIFWKRIKLKLQNIFWDRGIAPVQKLLTRGFIQQIHIS